MATARICVSGMVQPTHIARNADWNASESLVMVQHAGVISVDTRFGAELSRTHNKSKFEAASMKDDVVSGHVFTNYVLDFGLSVAERKINLTFCSDM